MRWTCPKCEGELEFDIEGPDYEVGIMGYAAAMHQNADASWECGCDFTPEEIEALEWAVAEEYDKSGPDWGEP